MKKLIVLFLIIITLTALASCGGKTETKIEDSQENCASSYYSASASSPDSYYFINNFLVYVVDKKTHKCSPLCNKPNCLHEKESWLKNCNASVPGLSESKNILYYGGYLYLLCEPYGEQRDADGNPVEETQIIKMSLDGTEREVIFSTTSLMISFLKVHRGYFYFNAIGLKNMDIVENSEAMYRLSVNGGEAEILNFDPFKSNRDAYLTSDYRFFGDYMYVEYLYRGNPEDDEPNDDGLARYNLETGECEEVGDKIREEHPDSLLDYTILNDKLYFTESGILYESRTDGSKAKEIMNLKDLVGDYDYYSVANNDGENIIISCSFKGTFRTDKYVFCDSEYNATVLDVPKDISTQSYFGGTPENSYFNSRNSDGVIEKYFLDKTKLGSDDCLEKIYEFEE